MKHFLLDILEEGWLQMVSVYVFTFIISTGDLYEISYFTFRNIDAI